MSLSLAPISFAEAARFVDANHRHHRAPRGHKFSIAATVDGVVVGVAIVGRPISRVRDDGLTLEVTRLCTGGQRNAPSFLLGAAARAAFAMGYRRIGTYTLASESGVSLRAAGWQLLGEVRGRSWDCPSRPRTDNHPTVDKHLWELAA